MAWEKLAWQFRRPHKPQLNERGNGSSSTESERNVQGVAAPAAASTSRETVRPALEIDNGVTSRNNKRSAKERAVATQKRKQNVAGMHEHLNKVQKNDLVFVNVSDMEEGEGELAIALARVLQDCDGGDCLL